MSIDVIDWARDNMMPMHGIGCPAEGPCVCGISDRYERWLDDSHALRAALAAEADRGTPDHESKGWPCGNCHHDPDAHSPVNRETCAMPGCDCPGLLTPGSRR